MENHRIPLIIPAYEPDERLITLLDNLREAGICNIVLVDDGSGESYQALFDQAQREYGCTLLTHEVNKGKGRALKDAFSYCLDNCPEIMGCVTADSDGQHTTEDIIRCMEALEREPDHLIMGCRSFSRENVPWKSYFGNTLTRNVCGWLSGVSVSDTQTGLRAIPRAFMRELLSVDGERFEFEMNMLVESKGRYPITEVVIQTVYDSKENHSTHFDPVRDSIRIYRVFGKMLLRFLSSSLLSAIIDLALFWVFCKVFRPVSAVFYVTIAAVAARVISATCNYLVNYSFVFRSMGKRGKTFAKYVVLAAVQMTLSASLVTAGVYFFPALPELLIKIIVDVILFLISYWIQREYVFEA
jgi:putative flippase GtrA